MSLSDQSPIAERFRPFGTTIFTEMSLLAAKHGAVNLAQGFPDFDGPEFVKRAAAEAMASGHNQYARMYGVPALNGAIASAWSKRTGAAIDPDTQVTVTSGCTEALAAAMLGLVNPGDEVILFEPYYDSYLACVAMAGGVARVVTLRPPALVEGAGGRFQFGPDELRAAFTARTRLIVVNTPHNPTGKVFTREELGLIAGLCERHGVIALTDEVYEHLTYEDSLPHVSLASVPGMEDRTVTCSSVGKSFSLTGWKVGWAIASPVLTKAVRAAHQFLTFATATPMQWGAAAAVGMSPESAAYVQGLRAEFAWGRAFLGKALEAVGMRVFWPSGAYFIMAEWSGVRAAGRLVEEHCLDDRAFSRWITEHAGVAAIPPSAFYTNVGHARRLARFAFCKRRATLEEAVRRLAVLA